MWLRAHSALDASFIIIQLMNELILVDTKDGIVQLGERSYLLGFCRGGIPTWRSLLCPGFIRTDIQTLTPLQRQHHPQTNGTSLESIGAWGGSSTTDETAECWVQQPMLQVGQTGWQFATRIPEHKGGKVASGSTLPHNWPCVVLKFYVRQQVNTRATKLCENIRSAKASRFG